MIAWVGNCTLVEPGLVGWTKLIQALLDEFVDLSRVATDVVNQTTKENIAICLLAMRVKESQNGIPEGRNGFKLLSQIKVEQVCDTQTSDIWMQRSVIRLVQMPAIFGDLHPRRLGLLIKRDDEANVQIMDQHKWERLHHTRAIRKQLLHADHVSMALRAEKTANVEKDEIVFGKLVCVVFRVFGVVDSSRQGCALWSEKLDDVCCSIR